MKFVRNKRVVVAVDLTRPDGQRRLEGLMRYLHARKVQWDLRIKRTVYECLSRNVEAFPKWDIDGVIYAQPQHTPEAQEALSRLVSLDMPLVVLDPGDNPAVDRRTKDIAIVRTDPDSIGDTAAQCLIAQGACRSYGYVPDVLDRKWSQRRGEAFASALGAFDTPCSFFRPKSFGTNDFAELCEWLKALPKPAGLLAAYDDRALTVIEACSAAGLAIPRDISLLSVDDDVILCENCRPALSSIRPDQESSGYAAGALLAALMRKGNDQPHVLRLPVKSVSHRESTLAFSHAGRLVQGALGFIRKNCRRRIGPKDVARHLGVSRPLLDLRFRQLLGTSVGKTVEAERPAAVCEALRSDRSIKEIAERCGYSDASQLMHRFKKHFGITANEYRKLENKNALLLGAPLAAIKTRRT